MEVDYYRNLRDQIGTRNSIRGALFVMRELVPEFKDCHLGYEYFVRPKSYMRGDIIAVTTLPNSIIDKYKPSGGENADPIVENIVDMDRRITIELPKICNNKTSKYYKNEFFMDLQKIGLPIISAYDLLAKGDFGFGALSVMKPDLLTGSERTGRHYSLIGYSFHLKMKSEGYLGRHLGVTEKERDVLDRMAAGRTAHDVAQKAGVTTRTIEMRLASARKKLKARTTNEAIYKSVCYGIL